LLELRPMGWLGTTHLLPVLCAARRMNSRCSLVSWIGMLEQRKAQAIARRADPWRLPLGRLRGKIGDDGIERISTQAVFDVLEVLQRSRGAGACRRLAKLMREGRLDAYQGAGFEPGRLSRSNPRLCARAKTITIILSPSTIRSGQHRATERHPAPGLKSARKMRALR
jgi:hypothetical protein